MKFEEKGSSGRTFKFTVAISGLQAGWALALVQQGPIIDCPPLSSRREEMQPLLQTFLRFVVRSLSKQVNRPFEAAFLIGCLQNFDAFLRVRA